MATEKLMLGYLPPFFNVLHLFVAANTIVIYNTHYYIKKLEPGISDRADWSRENKWVHPFLIALGCLASGICLFYLNFSVISVSLGLGVLSFAYSLPILPFTQKKRLKDWGLLKLVLLALVWSFVTVLIPMVYWQKHFQDYEVEFFMRFCFMIPLCIAFDIRDMETDKQHKIFTIPNAIGIQNTYRLIDFFLFLFGVLAIWQFFRYPLPFRLLSAFLIIIFSKVAITFSKKASTDIYYLFIIDGMMLMYAFFIFLLG